MRMMTRDKEILEIAANFNGKIYLPVLEKTLWFFDQKTKKLYKNGKQQAINRLNSLVKMGLLKTKMTGLMNPQKVFILTNEGKRYCEEEFDIEVGEVYHSFSTIEHTILEQITFYYLNKAGLNPFRTIKSEWLKDEKHKYCPDLAYFDPNGKLVYVECERTKKSTPDRYNRVMELSIEDGAEKVLYVFSDEKIAEKSFKLFPSEWENLEITYLDYMMSSFKVLGNLDFATLSQDEYLEKLLKKDKNE